MSSVHGAGPERAASGKQSRVSFMEVKSEYESGSGCGG